MLIKEIESEEEIKQAGELANLCFHDWEIEKNIEFYKKLKDCYFIGLFENSKLTSAGGSYEFQVFIKNQLFNCSGICHIMTDPRSRRKGNVKKIMEKILLEKLSRGYEISALWPFKHSFYQKFGYEPAEKPIVYKFSPSDIKNELILPDNFSFRLISENEDYPLLNEISKNAQNKNTRIIGNHDAWFLRGSFDKFLTYIIEKENEAKGFVVLKFQKPKDKEWGRNLLILDFAYETIEIKKALFGFLRNFESDIGDIILNCPPEEEIFSYLKSVKSEHRIATWPIMFRILNLKAYMEKLPFSVKTDAILYSKVDDEIIPDNKGIWKFVIKEGKCKAELTKENVSKEKILNLKIGELTQITIGYQNVKKLLETREEDIPSEWLDEEIFPEKPCWTGIWF